MRLAAAAEGTFPAALQSEAKMPLIGAAERIHVTVNANMHEFCTEARVAVYGKIASCQSGVKESRTK